MDEPMDKKNNTCWKSRPQKVLPIQKGLLRKTVGYVKAAMTFLLRPRSETLGRVVIGLRKTQPALHIRWYNPRREGAHPAHDRREKRGNLARPRDNRAESESSQN